MMGEVAKLTAGSNGALDPADYERTVRHALVGRVGPGDFQGAGRGLDACDGNRSMRGSVAGGW
jgi:hypothetical protein